MTISCSLGVAEAAAEGGMGAGVVAGIVIGVVAVLVVTVVVIFFLIRRHNRSRPEDWQIQSGDAHFNLCPILVTLRWFQGSWRTQI